MRPPTKINETSSKDQSPSRGGCLTKQEKNAENHRDNLKWSFKSGTTYWGQFLQRGYLHWDFTKCKIQKINHTVNFIYTAQIMTEFETSHPCLFLVKQC